MNNLNTVLVEGNLTRDPKEIIFGCNFKKCQFSIANNRYYLKNGAWTADTSFFIVEVFGSSVQACLNYLKKGRGVRVVGRLRQMSWKTNGIPHETVTIIAEHIEFQPERQDKNFSQENTQKTMEKKKNEKSVTFAQSSQNDIAQTTLSEKESFHEAFSSEETVEEDMQEEDLECTVDIPEEKIEPNSTEEAIGEVFAKKSNKAD